MWNTPLNRAAYRSLLTLVAATSRVMGIREQLILSLHSVSDDGEFASGLSISRRFLESIILDCAKRAIPIVSLAEALERSAALDDEPFLVLTFDDGYGDLFRNGFPVLRRYGTPFTVFVTTGLVDRTAPMWWHALEIALTRSDEFRWWGTSVPTATARQKSSVFEQIATHFRSCDVVEQGESLRALADENGAVSLQTAYGSALDWDMVRQMAESGLGEIGAHSVTHPLFARLPRESLQTEIEGSRHRIRTMADVEPRYFAYPYGQDNEVGPTAPQVVAECGFEAGFTTMQLPISGRKVTDAFRLPRLVLSRKGQSLGVLQAYMSGLPQSARAALRS